MQVIKSFVCALLFTGVAALLAAVPVSAAGKIEEKSAASAIRYRAVKVEGLDIFYREAGDPSKPTLLLLHGFPTSSFMFRELIPRLSDRFHLIAPDYPGFGQSSMPTVDQFEYSFERLTDIVDKFTVAVGISKYSLYVQDYGSPIGFRLATKHPERVQVLIIQNGNAYDVGLSEAAQFLKTYGQTRDAKTTSMIRSLLTLKGTRFQYVQGAGDLSLISPDTWIHDQALLDRPGNIDVQLALFADYASNVREYPKWHEYFRKYQPPTLVVWGKNDPFFTVKGVENGYRQDLKNIEVNYFDGGHFALEEFNAEIAERIRAFFEKRKIS